MMRKGRFFCPFRFSLTLPQTIRIKNRNPVIPHLAASSCIGAMTFSSVAREIKATPHPMETIAIRNMIIVMF